MFPTIQVPEGHVKQAKLPWPSEDFPPTILMSIQGIYDTAVPPIL